MLHPSVPCSGFKTPPRHQQSRLLPPGHHLVADSNARYAVYPLNRFASARHGTWDHELTLVPALTGTSAVLANYHTESKIVQTLPRIQSSSGEGSPLARTPLLVPTLVDNQPLAGTSDQLHYVSNCVQSPIQYCLTITLILVKFL